MIETNTLTMEANKDFLYNSLVETIKTKIPGRGKITTFLVDLLCIEKEAVYRRLRGEVPFTFSEIVEIAKELDISLDNLVQTSAPKSRPFQMKIIDFINPTERDFFMIENYARILDDAKKDPDSECGYASNMIPINLCLCYLNLYKFHLLKWMYQLGDSECITYGQITPSERLMDINQKSAASSRLIGKTYFIWDKNTLPALINDILYFYDIRLIARDEIDLIKNDLFLFLNDLEKMAILGKYETGKRIEIYVSNLNFETTYNYVQAGNHQITNIRSFTLNDTISTDRTVFEKVKKWMDSLVRTSILISGSNEVQRIQFFEKQREILSRL
ncbi:hypothetical protein LJB95_00745 [Paludibacteraceae bacterium OttesenSCG-928-F17]|nr:hypothetical protein [Paludibacteraceae bacterium OttesenSCG-928-F17]